MKYRIHFLISENRDDVAACWLGFLELAESSGILPARMFQTASTKEGALKRPVDISADADRRLFLLRRLNGEDWPVAVITSLWAAAASGDQTWHVRFSARKNRGMFQAFIVLTISTTSVERDFAFFECLRHRLHHEIIVFRFEPNGSEVDLAIDGNGQILRPRDRATRIPRILDRHHRRFCSLFDQVGFRRP